MNGLFLLAALAAVGDGVARGGAYNRLFEDLLGRYNKLVRPSVAPNDTVKIAFRLKLSELMDVHEKEQVITTSGWLIHQWVDERLSWRPPSYGGVRTMQVPGEIIWLPDVILYNNAHGSPYVNSITKAELRYDGLVTWTPPVIYNSMCKINVEWFPYDEQLCDMKFGSWTYSWSQLDLVHLLAGDVVEEKTAENETEWKVERGVDISQYKESVEFDLMSVVGVRHEKIYSCCDYPSIDITYYVNIRRKKLFYTVNLVGPCFGIAALTCFVFYLPCESHQKVQLCISILVSLTVFFLVLTDNIPPTSLCIPLIVKYLLFTMIMVTASVITTVIVNNFHFRLPDSQIPDWMRRLFIENLGSRIFKVRGPPEAVRRERSLKRMNALNAMMILEKQFNKTLFHLEMASRERTKEMKVTSELFLRLPLAQRSKSFRAKEAPTSANKRASFARQSITESKTPTDTTQTAATKELRRAERNVHYIAQTLVARRRAEEAIHYDSSDMDQNIAELGGLEIPFTRH